MYVNTMWQKEIHMCSPELRKEANRLNWIIKGKLIDTSWSDIEVEKTYHSYFKRLWGNNEIYLHEEGFAEAWEKEYGC
tara:strand:- start:528 stop:761 length:234 start_codon:yes stop_codon:yes gene_type:complete